MKVKFPAMQATIGQRTYYACVMKLSEIPQLFTFWDWIECTPEDREQRVLNEKRIPDIARYILENEDGYLFSSITASYKCRERFEPVGSDSLGYLELDLDGENFVINDGQHRCAAIKQAIKENPALRKESISVLLFPYESKERVQQMFADLNRFVVKTNNATNIIFDHHDTLAKVTKEVCEIVPVFQGLVDKENQSLPVRSDKAFTLYSLYDATKELVADQATSTDADFDALVKAAVDYWTTVSNFMPDWQKVRNREVRPIELRQENISTHSVVLRALGGVGAEIVKRYPSDWKERLAGLKGVTWNKKNRDWENVCMVANSVVANRQARVATKAYLKRKLGIPVSEAEQRSIEHLTARDGFATGVAAGTTSNTGNNRGNSDFILPPRKKPAIHPSEVRVGTSVARVDKSNQILITVAEWIIKQGKTLPRIRNFVHETDSGFSRAAKTVKLSNGWFIEIGDSQETLIRKSRRLLDACGFRDVRLEVVLEDGTVKTA
jgi:DNA sulfur modification protein DndB